MINIICSLNCRRKVGSGIWSSWEILQYCTKFSELLVAFAGSANHLINSFEHVALLEFSCLVVLLEPLHKMVFLHLSSLMAQGSAPEVDNFPPAVKWYLRLLRKCSGKVAGSENKLAASIIKNSDIDFLFWPFIISSVETWANFTLCNQSSSKEVRDWSSRHGIKIKSWRDSLIDQLRSDLRVRWG